MSTWFSEKWSQSHQVEAAAIPRKINREEENILRVFYFIFYRSIFKECPSEFLWLEQVQKYIYYILTGIGQSESVSQFWNVKGQIFHSISSWLLYIKKKKKIHSWQTASVEDRVTTYGHLVNDFDYTGSWCCENQVKKNIRMVSF